MAVAAVAVVFEEIPTRQTVEERLARVKARLQFLGRSFWMMLKLCARLERKM